LNHLLRLTGVFAYVIFFHTTLARVFQGGPGDPLPIGIDNCRASWWKHLLYFTNFDSDITVSFLLKSDKNFFLDNILNIYKSVIDKVFRT
jgi:hypothetical protein